MADWTTISALATAGGTLVLAGATFASVRSANRAARAAERALLAGLRPLLLPSRLEDVTQKVHFVDGKIVPLAGGTGTAEVTDRAIYLTLSLRNVGTGIAVLHGWSFRAGQVRTADQAEPVLEDFHRLTRDLYLAAGDVGFWQGSFRDVGSDEFAAARAAIENGDPLTIEVLYGDEEGGQRVVTRFALLPREDGRLMAAASRHWNLDRPDPR
jgi:hypothetical protein